MTIFTDIINAGVANIVYSDEYCSVILDIQPAAPGHCLVIPKEETDQWTDLTPELAGHLMQVAQKVGHAQKKIFSCARVGIMIAGFEVPHTHIHVIPINGMDDFVLGKAQAPEEELEENKKKLEAAII